MNKTTVSKAVYFLSGLLFVIGLFTIVFWIFANEAQRVNRALEWRNSRMQSRIDELEKQLDDMTRNAVKFLNELEECQREKDFELRERIESICSGYTTQVKQ